MVPYGSKLSEKLKRDFKIYEGCFLWFYVDINSAHLIESTVFK